MGGGLDAAHLQRVDTFDNWSTPGHRGEQVQWGGRTWYRKTFRLLEAYRGKRAFIEFEGVRQVAEVYLDGTRLGVSKIGFAPLGFDLTPHLKFGRGDHDWRPLETLRRREGS